MPSTESQRDIVGAINGLMSRLVTNVAEDSPSVSNRVALHIDSTLGILKLQPFTATGASSRTALTDGKTYTMLNIFAQ